MSCGGGGTREKPLRGRLLRPGRARWGSRSVTEHGFGRDDRSGFADTELAAIAELERLDREDRESTSEF